MVVIEEPPLSLPCPPPPHLTFPGDWLSRCRRCLLLSSHSLALRLSLSMSLRLPLPLPRPICSQASWSRCRPCLALPGQYSCRFHYPCRRLQYSREKRCHYNS